MRLLVGHFLPSQTLLTSRASMCTPSPHSLAAPTAPSERRAAARRLIRSHRLWEAWLTRNAGIAPDHVHDTAMRLEHVTDVPMMDRLVEEIEDPTERFVRQLDKLVDELAKGKAMEKILRGA